MSRPPSIDRTWRPVLEAHAALLRIYERELKDACDLPLAWYDVLVQLAESGRRSAGSDRGSSPVPAEGRPPGAWAGAEPIRMSELADRLLLSRSWLTRRIAGMEAAGLVGRCKAAGDGRGVCAYLTEHGWSVYGPAARVHGESIRTHFLAYIDDTDTDTIEAVFGRIAARARAPSPRR